jgi:hypothetical protein
MRTVKRSYGYKHPRKREKKPVIEDSTAKAPGAFPLPEHRAEGVCAACGYPDSMGHDPDCGWVKGDIVP